GKILRHAHQRHVDRLVAMGMVLTDHVAHDARGFAVGLVVLVALLVHRIEDAPMHGLQPVAHVRKRARHDHAHRIVEIRLAHFVGDRDQVDVGRRKASAVVVWRVGHSARSWSFRSLYDMYAIPFPFAMFAARLARFLPRFPAFRAAHVCRRPSLLPPPEKSAQTACSARRRAPSHGRSMSQTARHENISIFPFGMRSDRLAVSTMFLVNGMVVGAWSAKIPALVGRLGINEATMG